MTRGKYRGDYAVEVRLDGEVVSLVDGRPTMDALRPVSRLGRDEWGHSPEVFRLQRPRRP